MDILARAAGVGLMAAVLGAVLKKENPALALLLCGGAVCVILVSVLNQASAVIAAAGVIGEAAGISSAVSSAIWKTVAISVVTRLACGVCTDGGQASAAAAVELAGCTAGVLAAIPLMETVLEMVGVLL